MSFNLPQLDYNYNSLEPYIDAKTMEIHHSKHHQGYTNNLKKRVIQHNTGKGAKFTRGRDEMEMVVTEAIAAINEMARHNMTCVFHEALDKKGNVIEIVLGPNHQIYVDLLDTIYPKKEVRQRLDELAEIEASVIGVPDDFPRFHS